MRRVGLRHKWSTHGIVIHDSAGYSINKTRLFANIESMDKYTAKPYI